MTTADQTATAVFTTPSDRELVITRVFDAPRSLVFDAWTRPEHLPHWLMGPDGWTMTSCDIDLRPGGEWHFGWRRENGSEMEMRGVYREIAPPAGLVTTEAWGGSWPETLNTLLLSEENGRTTMMERVLYPSREARDAAWGPGMQEGVAASFDRLAAYLRTLA